MAQRIEFFSRIGSFFSNSGQTSEQAPNGYTQVAQADGNTANDANGQTVQLPPSIAGATITKTYTSSEGAKIELGSGTAIDKVIIFAGNLYFVQPDGSVVVIIDGAKYVPTLIVLGAEIPALELARTIEGAGEDVPTAGPVTAGDSSGGNFAVPPGQIGPPLDLTPLLPPTALQFGLSLPRFFEGLFDEEEAGTTVTPVLEPLPPPTIGEPERGAVEEDDLGFIVTVANVRSPSSISEPKIGNDLDGSRPTALSFTGNLDVNFNGVPGSIEFPSIPTGTAFQTSTGIPLTSNGEPVVVELLDPQTLIGYVDGDGNLGFESGGGDHLVFRVELTDPVDPSTPGGSYQITVFCNLDHDDPVHNGQDGDTDGIDDGFPTPGDEELLALTFPFVVTTGGGTANGEFTTDWQDDMPIIGEGEEPYGDEIAFQPLVDEDPGLPGGQQGGPGDDNGGLTASGGLNILWGSDHGNSNDPNATFGDRMVILTGFTVTDENGTIVYDQSVNNLKALVPASSGSTDLVQADVTVIISTDVNQQSVLTGQATAPDGTTYDVFVVTTSDVGSGSFFFELKYPLVHPLQDDPSTTSDVETSYEDNLTFTFDFNAKDSDLDTVSGQFAVVVDDDSPTPVTPAALAKDDMAIVDESADDGSDPDGVNGAPQGQFSATVTLSDNFSHGAINYGADGPGSVSYALVLSSEGLSSGLFALDPNDTETVIDPVGQGDPILLYTDGTKIVGSTAADAGSVNPGNTWCQRCASRSV